MALPSQAELQARSDAAEKRLAELKFAHDTFLAELEKIESAENNLLKQAREYLDKSKMHQILHHINTLK